MPSITRFEHTVFASCQVRRVCSLLVLSVLYGCSGGGGGSDSSDPAPVSTTPTVPPSNNTPPSASIDSPAAGSMVSSLTVSVSGQASDSDGVASVQVNGVSASSDNGFSNWVAEVPVTEGDNTLVVSATDQLGNVNTQAASRRVSRGYLFDRAAAIISDISRQRALLIDEGSPRIMMIDANNRQRSEFSGASVGQGPKLQQPTALLMDTSADRALVFDEGNSTLLAVDLNSGDRQELSGSSRGSGPQLQNLVLWSLEPSGRNAYALSRASLFKIDLASGDRQTTPLFGATLNSPHTARFDARYQRLLVSDAQTIYAIDVNNGTVTSLLE